MKSFLTLPVNDFGELDGRAAKVREQEDVLPWYSYADGKEKFITPDGGAVTETAKYARCERHLLRKHDLTSSFSDRRIFSVQSLPMDHKTIVHQLHDGDLPLVKIAYNRKESGDTLRALVKVNGKQNGDYPFLLAEGLLLGDRVDCTLGFVAAKDGKAPYSKITVNGQVLRIDVDISDYGPLHFQYGNYYQNRERQGNHAEVWFHDN